MSPDQSKKDTMSALPNNLECIRVLSLLSGDPHLTTWEKDFIEDNLDRVNFTSLQKETINRFKEKYECG